MVVLKLILFALLVLGEFNPNEVFGSTTKVSFDKTNPLMKWQYVGRNVDSTINATLTASTSLSFKARAPHVDSVPHMIILGSQVTRSGGCLSLNGSQKPIIKARTSNTELKDELSIDLGQVTVNGTCEILFFIKFQLINHTKFSEGAKVSPSFAVQETGGTVHALQHGVRTLSPRSRQPSLKVVLEPADPVFDGGNSKMAFNVRVTHNVLRTSSMVVTAEITIVHPASFVYSKFEKVSGSVDVTKKAVSGLVFQVGKVEFYQFVEFNLEFTYQPAHPKRGRDLERTAFYADVTAKGPGSCPNKDPPFSEFQPTISVAVYRPFETCENPQGSSGSDSIRASTYTASSYGKDSNANRGKFGENGAWKPSDSLKYDLRQYLEVKFYALARIRRFAIKGLCDTPNDTDRFVKSVEVYHSINGALWKPVMEGSYVKVFKALSTCKGTTIIPLPYDIEANFVRVRPVDFENAIAMKLKFFGCKSTTPVKVPPFTIRNRSIIAYLDYIIVCNTGMNRRFGESSCYYSSDGKAWKALYFLIKYVAFYTTDTKILYAVGGKDGIVAFSNKGLLDGRWDVIAMSELTTAKSGRNTKHASSADNLYITDDHSLLIPKTSHIFSANKAGITWGFSAQGVHSSTNAGSTWSLKAIWNYKETKAKHR